MPDPHAEATFAAARLSWSWPEGTPRAGLRRLYQDLLAARRQWPALRDFERRTARLLPDAESGPVLELVRGEGRAYFNLRDQPQALPGGVASEHKLLFSSEWGRYGGSRKDRSLENLLSHECVVFGPAAWKSVTGERGSEPR